MTTVNGLLTLICVLSAILHVLIYLRLRELSRQWVDVIRKDWVARGIHQPQGSSK
jgi:hypothetical protein